MDSETLHELVDVNILVSTKARFTGDEQKKIYNLYNILTGEKKIPNGCSACLNSTITRIKKIAREHGI